MFSSVTPYASHTTFSMNENWSGSSFPTPLNTGNFIALAILNCGGGGGSVGEDGGEDGKTGGGVGGSGMRRIRCHMKWITLLGETFASYSLLSRIDEIKGLVSNFVLPSFFVDPPTLHSPKHQFIHITHFSHSSVLIQPFKDLT